MTKTNNENETIDVKTNTTNNKYKHITGLDAIQEYFDLCTAVPALELNGRQLQPIRLF